MVRVLPYKQQASIAISARLAYLVGSYQLKMKPHTIPHLFLTQPSHDLAYIFLHVIASTWCNYNCPICNSVPK